MSHVFVRFLHVGNVHLGIWMAYTLAFCKINYLGQLQGFCCCVFLGRSYPGTKGNYISSTIFSNLSVWHYLWSTCVFLNVISWFIEITFTTDMHRWNSQDQIPRYKRIYFRAGAWKGFAVWIKTNVFCIIHWFRQYSTQTIIKVVSFIWLGIEIYWWTYAWLVTSYYQNMYDTISFIGFTTTLVNLILQCILAQHAFTIYLSHFRRTCSFDIKFPQTSTAEVYECML